MASVLKSRPPASRLLIGMIISSTRDLIMVVKAPPTATPIVSSTTLPRLINSPNSFRKELFLKASNKLSVSVFFVIVYIIANSANVGKVGSRFSWNGRKNY